MYEFVLVFRFISECLTKSYDKFTWRLLVFSVAFSIEWKSSNARKKNQHLKRH